MAWALDYSVSNTPYLCPKPPLSNWQKAKCLPRILPTEIEARPFFGFLKKVPIGRSLDVCTVLHQEGHQCHVPPLNGDVQGCLACGGCVLLACSQSAHCRGTRMGARGGPGQQVLMTPTTGGGQARIPKGRPENP